MSKEIPNQEHIRKLIDKVLAGNITAEEKRLLDAWYDEQEKEKAVVFTAMSRKAFQDRLFVKTLEKIDKAGNRKKSLWKTVGIAASIIFFIGIGLILKPPFTEDVPLTDVPAHQFRSFTNGKGEKRKITLPDGSSIHLSHNSSVKVNKNFSKERKVELIGEAFFEVVKNDTLPFVIKTQNLSATVLGTAFNISAQKDDPESVAVRSGKVRVENLEKGEAIKLSELQQSFFSNGELKVKKITDPEKVFGWTEGKLVFRNTPLPDIGPILENWYGVQVEILGSISSSCQLTGVYRELSLKSLMEIIQYSINIAYEIDGKKLKIISKDC